MKVIELLNKIANGEEVPKKIKYLIYEYTYNDEDEEYQRNKNEDIVGLGEEWKLDRALCDEVEVIEEEPRDIEVCGSLFTRSEYNKLFKEDKKIEKLDHEDFTDNFGGELITDMKLVNKINEIIDKINEGE